MQFVLKETHNNLYYCWYRRGVCGLGAVASAPAPFSDPAFAGFSIDLRCSQATPTEGAVPAGSTSLTAFGDYQ